MNDVVWCRRYKWEGYDGVWKLWSIKLETGREIIWWYDAIKLIFTENEQKTSDRVDWQNNNDTI